VFEFATCSRRIQPVRLKTTVELNCALGLVEIRLADFALDANSGSQINQTMSMALP
jgi:hypothetical protein